MEACTTPYSNKRKETVIYVKWCRN